MVYVKRIFNLPAHLTAIVLPTIIFAMVTMIALMDPMRDWIIAVSEITVHKKDTSYSKTLKLIRKRKTVHHFKDSTISNHPETYFEL